MYSMWLVQHMWHNKVHNKTTKRVQNKEDIYLFVLKIHIGPDSFLRFIVVKNTCTQMVSLWLESVTLLSLQLSFSPPPNTEIWMVSYCKWYSDLLHTGEEDAETTRAYQQGSTHHIKPEHVKFAHALDVGASPKIQAPDLPLPCLLIAVTF